MKPCNTKAIAANIELVFKTRDILRLNKPTYDFVNLTPGFIAHYNLEGFQYAYQDLRDFVKDLLSSGYTTREEEAKYYETNFPKEQEYYQTKADTIRAIVKIAEKWKETIDREFGHHEADLEIELAQKLASKHGYTLEKALMLIRQ